MALHAVGRGGALAVVAVVITACGGNATEPSTPTASTPAASTPTSTTPETTETQAEIPVPSANEIAAAERAVKKELPDIPLWKGARFRGEATGKTGVCVDRTITEASADAIGGNRTSHVVVTLPGLSTGEPQDGACAKADENADKAITASRRFYERTDDDAIALDEVVADVQNDELSATERLARLRARISKRVTDYLLAGGDTSVGGNLLVSAATTAVSAASSGDVAQLAKVRRDIAEARSTLADEAIR